MAPSVTPAVVPTVTAVRMTGAARRAELPLLVLGPAPGTSASALWTACAAHLTDRFDVLAWDLPGHGHNTGVGDEPFTLAGLAAGVLRVVDDVLVQRDQGGGSFSCAGVSVGGAVGLQLALDAPGRVEAAVLLGGGAGPGSTEPSASTWFAPGFVEREPDVVAGLLRARDAVRGSGYAQACGALAEFDVRDRLGEVVVPVLVVAGTEDALTPPAGPAEVADGVPDGRLVTLDGVGHLAPVEAPAEVAALIGQHLLGEADANGLAAATADFTRDLEELATHVRVARSRGLSADEIRECLLQAAVHVDRDVASAASRVARSVLADES